MSTRSRIGIKNADGTITSIYCHYDGRSNGTILQDHYNSEERARALIALGDISLLDAKLEPEPGQAHSFDHRAEGVTVAYGRDRGEKGTEAVTSKDEEAYYDLGADSWAECLYLWDGDCWRELMTEGIFHGDEKRGKIQKEAA